LGGEKRSASSAAMQPWPAAGHRLAVDVVGDVAGGKYPGTEVAVENARS
jgi:hypothetical protein